MEYIYIYFFLSIPQSGAIKTQEVRTKNKQEVQRKVKKLQSEATDCRILCSQCVYTTSWKGTWQKYINVCISSYMEIINSP